MDGTIAGQATGSTAKTRRVILPSCVVMPEAVCELRETHLGLAAKRIELYQSFGIIETKSKTPRSNANDQ
jgi:hypothetical protein